MELDITRIIVSGQDDKEKEKQMRKVEKRRALIKSTTQLIIDTLAESYAYIPGITVVSL